MRPCFMDMIFCFLLGYAVAAHIWRLVFAVKELRRVPGKTRLDLIVTPFFWPSCLFFFEIGSSD